MVLGPILRKKGSRSLLASTRIEARLYPDILNLYSLYYAYEYLKCIAQMIGRCEQCGMTDVEVKTIRIGKNDKTRTLCNQCRPADGAYAY
jgi:hypothetical protein